MAETTNISWSDHTWSPWYGCTQVSMGEHGACEGCYARFLSETRQGRVIFGGPGRGEGTRDAKAESGWKEPLKWEREAAALARAWRAGPDGGMGRPWPYSPFIFPSLCDPFDNHPDLPPLRRRFFDLIRATPHLTWLLLTKRPGNIVKLAYDAMSCPGEGPVNMDFVRMAWPRNAAIGCTVVTQEEADRDIPKLLAAKAALNPAFAFVSMEPLLGAVDISLYLGDNWADGREQEQRGVHLSGGPDRRVGDHAGRHDLARQEAGLGSLDRRDRYAAMPAGPGRAVFGTEGGVPAGQPHAGRQAGLRAGAPAGLAPLQGAYPGRDDGQPSGRPEEAQPAGQSGTRDRIGAAGPCGSGAQDEQAGASERRGQQDGDANGRAGGRDQASAEGWREAAGDSRRLWDRDADGLQDRTRGPSSGLDWCISGGETDQGSHKARPSHPDWFRSLRDQCAAAGVAYHHKQNGEWAHSEDQTPPTPGPQFFDAEGLPKGDGWHFWTDGDHGANASIKVGKKAAGRLLDGVVHDAMPEERS